MSHRPRPIYDFNKYLEVPVGCCRRYSGQARGLIEREATRSFLPNQAELREAFKSPWWYAPRTFFRITGFLVVIRFSQETLENFLPLHVTQCKRCCAGNGDASGPCLGGRGNLGLSQN